MNWNKVHFYHTGYTFPGVLCSHVFPRDAPHMSHIHTHKRTHFLCWGLTWVFSVGLRGPAAQSMVCVCVSECVCVWEGIWAIRACMCIPFVFFSFLFSFLLLFFNVIKPFPSLLLRVRVSFFCVSLHALNKLYYQSFHALSIPKVCQLLSTSFGICIFLFFIFFPLKVFHGSSILWELHTN